MKKRTIILIGLLVTLAVFGGGYGVYRFAKGNTTPVEVTPVSYLNIGWWGYETTSSGTITSNAIQEVHLDNDQVVAEVRVKEGDRVQIGDVLLTYDTTLLELDLESAEISRKSIELQLLTAKEELQKLNNITPIADPVDDGSSYDYEDPEYAANAVLMPNELTLRASSEEQEMPSVESEEMGKGTEDPTEPVSDPPTEPVSDPPTESVSDPPTESEQPVMDEAASRAVSESSTEPVIEQSAESQTELPTESVTEAPTEPVTEAPTEPVTEAPTEPVTEAPTEPVTEAPTEPVTEAPTEPVTEAPTEPVTEAPTEPVTEAPTEPVTEAPTEPVTEAPTEPVTEAPTEPVTEAPTEPMTEAPQTETQDTEPPTETETESETESETEPETSPMGNVKAYSKLNYKSKPYKGEGTKEDPYVFFCKDGAVVKASFMNMVLGFVSDGTTKKDGGFRKDGEGSYVVLEIREGDDVTGGFIKGIQINGTRKNDSSYDPSTSWIFTCDGLEKETEEVTEPDTVDTEPDTGWDDPDWDDPGWDDPGWDDPGWDDPGTDVYTVSELKEAISQKEDEIRELELEIRSADLRVQQAQRKVDEAMVKATLNGVVKEVGDPEIGDIDGEAFITVTSNSGMYVKGTVSELELSQVKVGSIITGTSGDSYVSFEAEITEISEYPTSSSDYYYYGDSNPNVSYYPFTAYIDDAEGIRNNEWAELTIQGSGEDTSESLYIDKRYIRSENGQSYVYKAGSDNKLEKQYIKTGQTLYSQYVEIKQGLSLTDSIAFPYGKNVYEGAPVKTEEDGYPADEGENFDDDLNSMDEYGEDYDDYDYSDELGGFEDLDDGTFFDDEVSYDDMDVLE